jgi:hypothetical protein
MYGLTLRISREIVSGMSGIHASRRSLRPNTACCTQQTKKEKIKNTGDARSLRMKEGQGHD